ncbi:MAG TPA: hypothetical protein VGN37_20305 [Actinocatenispora sp.]
MGRDARRRRRALAAMGIGWLAPRSPALTPPAAVRADAGVAVCDLLVRAGVGDASLLTAAYWLPTQDLSFGTLPGVETYPPHPPRLSPPPRSWDAAVLAAVAFGSVAARGYEALLPPPGQAHRPLDPAYSGLVAAIVPPPPAAPVERDAYVRQLRRLPADLRTLALAGYRVAADQGWLPAGAPLSADGLALLADGLPVPVRTLLGVPESPHPPVLRPSLAIAEPAQAVSLVEQVRGAPVGGARITVRAFDDLTYLVRLPDDDPAAPPPMPGDTSYRPDLAAYGWIVDRLTGTVRRGLADPDGVRLPPMPIGWHPGAPWPPAGALVADARQRLAVEPFDALRPALDTLDSRYAEATLGGPWWRTIRAWSVARAMLSRLHAFGASGDTLHDALSVARCPVTGQPLPITPREPQLARLAYDLAGHTAVEHDRLRSPSYRPASLAAVGADARLLVAAYAIAVAEAEIDLYGRLPEPRRAALTALSDTHLLPADAGAEVAAVLAHR